MNGGHLLFMVIGIIVLAKFIVFTLNIFHANASIQKKLGKDAYRELIQ